MIDISDKEINMKMNVNSALPFLATVCLLAVASSTFAVTITESDITSADSAPSGVTSATDGAIWFAEEGASKIGRVNPTTGAVINEYPTLTANAGPTGMASLGNFVWFTEQTANNIARINLTTPVVEEFPTNIAGALPNAIAAGPTGSLYFTEKGTGKLGRIDAGTGAISEVPNVTLSGAAGIVLGPDNNMWITEGASDRITRFDPASGVLTRFTLTNGSGPAGIAVGPDNFIWFTMPGRNRIGKIDPNTSNAITEYAGGISTASRPNYIAVGADGNLWYTTQGGGRIGRVTTDGGIIEFTSGITAGSELRGIAADSATSTLFFASAANKIGEIANLTQIPATLRFQFEPFKVSEDCGEATITVIRDGDTSSAVAVDYATSDLTAKVSDDDYESASGKLNFGVGVTSQSFTIKIKSGGGVESVEDVRLSLLNPTGGAEISTPTGTLQIFDGARLDDEGFGDTCDSVKLGGCTINRQKGFDPTLPVLLFLAMAGLISHRVLRNLRTK
jgi:streptogramin lyase